MKRVRVINLAWTMLVVCVLVGGITAPAFAGTRVPEIDGASVSSAVTLLVGGYLVVISRLRRK